MAAAALVSGVAAAQDWQIYNQVYGLVQELDALSVRSEQGKVFFAYRERHPGTTIRFWPIDAVVDCAANKRADVQRNGSYTLTDIYPNTGQALQASLACRLAQGVAGGPDWRIYNQVYGRVQELDARSVRSEQGKVFFAYRERSPGTTIPFWPIDAVVDCAANKRADVQRNGSYTLTDIYPNTGQALQASLACRLAQSEPTAKAEAADTAGAQKTPSATVVPDASVTRQPLKVAFIYVGPVGDGGWTYAHDAGRKAVQAQLAGRVEVSFVEGVPEGAEATPVLNRLIDQGHTLIFATAFGYQNPVAGIAQANPGVRFEQVSGYKPGRNVRTYDVRAEEGVYLAGVLAGHMTRSNVLGFVGAVPIPAEVRNINAFTLGARSVNPKVTVRVNWVGSWFDRPMEAKASRELIRSGADVLMQNTDSSQVIATAQQMGKRAIGWNSDMSTYGPKAHLASVVWNWGPYYVKAVRDALDGSWSGGRLRWGLREDAIRLQSVATDVPAKVRQELSDLTAKIGSGALQIWRGPISNNRGRLMVAQDSVIDEEHLETMYFYVDGVEGTLPRVP